MRVGISGIGNAGLRHVGTLSAMSEVEVVALADPRFGSGDAPEVGGITTFRSYDEMLGEVALEAVVLASPSGLHAEQGIQAAVRGINVISEKPLATTLSDADALLHTCTASGVRLAVLHQYRFSSPIAALRRLIRTGSLGKLVFLNVALNWRRSDEYYAEHGAWRGTWAMDGGGALMNQGSHAVDLARWLGGPIASVMAYTTTLTHDIETEDCACVNLKFEGGGLGVVQVTTSASENHPAAIRVQGTTASATVVGNTLVVNGGSASVESAPQRAVHPTTAHETQFREIFQALAEGLPPPVTGDDARETLATTLAMYESTRTGGSVAFDRIKSSTSA